jgi:hypothetical protein
VVNNASFEEWRPLIYVIPRSSMEARLKVVPIHRRTGPTLEYIIEDLKRSEFDIIENINMLYRQAVSPRIHFAAPKDYEITLKEDGSQRETRPMRDLNYAVAGQPLELFISYKWEDDAHNDWVVQLATDLRKAGIDAVLDRWEVRLGDSFTDYMTSRIAQADVVLFIMTTKSVAAIESPKGEGGAVKFEIQMVNARRIAGERMRLIPVYREGNRTAAHVRDHRYADFRDDNTYERSLKQLVDDLLGRILIPPMGPL